MPPPHKSALIAAVAGAVVGLSALTWGLVALKRRDHAAADDEGTVAPEQWSAAQVIHWLRDNGVSREALAACLRYRVTGEGLLRVTERDLYRMGVPLRDARVILAAVEELREGAALLSRLSQPPMSRQPSIASGSSRQQAAAAPVTTASPGARFEAAFNALVRTCMLHPQDASPAEQQQRVVVYTSALLECFQALSKREQATALALVAAAEDLPSPAPVSASPASLAAEPAAAVPPPAATAADGAFRAVAEKLQPLHSMVDGFLAFLQSPEVAAVSAAEMAELGGRVTEQVRRVVRVCEQLPPEMGGPLLRKCEKVFEVLTARQAGPKGEDSAAQQENARAIMRALSDVVAAVRDPGMRDLPAAQRAATLAELVERAEAIEELASGAVEGVPRDEKALQMVQPVLKLLREAVEVSAAEASARAAEDAEAATTPAAGDAAGQSLLSADDIPVVVETIQKVQQTIKSAEFQHAPAAVRAELCAVLSQRIAALEERTGGLPAPTQSAVRELLRNTKAVLAAVGNAATASPPPGAADDEEADEEAAEEEEEKEEAEAAAEEPVGAAGIERYVVQLEKIFEFLTSEALEHAPPQERQKMAEELMQRVDTIKAEIQGSPAEGPIVRDLIDPLYDLLQNMATRQAASPAFVAATAPLREVQGLLDSTSFQQLPHPEKMRIARDVVPQLQQLTAAFAALPPSERAAAEELVRPISEELLRIVRHRPTTGVSAQGVLDRLQGVMRTIQGAEFTTMTPAARSAWAGKAVAELQRLDNDCVALGSEGDALRPIVQRLQGQLQSLFAEEAAAAPATASANGGGAKADVLASVESMRAELAEAERRGASISPARLQQMLRVLTAAAEVADLTAAQEAAVQDFSEGLRRHVEGVTASLDDGAAAGDAAAADAAAEEEDALDSLRVSLRTLLELAEEGGGATGAELASLAASAEKFIAAADEAGVQWREDEECAAAVRRLLGLLQQSSATSGEGGDGAEAGEAPSRVEEVLKSSIQALTEAPPATREEFVPFMRVLQLAQPAAEQMTNRELLLLRSLQELIIESMRRLPRPTGEGEEVEEEEEEDEADDAEEGGGDEVDAVLDALLDMSFKLRDGVYSAEQLDEFEAIQQDLEGLLTRAGVDSTEAMASVKEQIRLQRRALSHAAGGDEDNEGGQREGAETSPLGGEDSRADADAFNEDDDEATSEGVSGPAGATGRSENDEESDE